MLMKIKLNQEDLCAHRKQSMLPQIKGTFSFSGAVGVSRDTAVTDHALMGQSYPMEEPQHKQQQRCFLKGDGNSETDAGLARAGTEAGYTGDRCRTRAHWDRRRIHQGQTQDSCALGQMQDTHMLGTDAGHTRAGDRRRTHVLGTDAGHTHAGDRCRTHTCRVPGSSFQL